MTSEELRKHMEDIWNNQGVRNSNHLNRWVWDETNTKLCGIPGTPRYPKKKQTKKGYTNTLYKGYGAWSRFAWRNT